MFVDTVSIGKIYPYIDTEIINGNPSSHTFRDTSNVYSTLLVHLGRRLQRSLQDGRLSVVCPSSIHIFDQLYLHGLPASVAQLDAGLAGDQEVVGSTPLGPKHSFVEIDHEIFSIVILSLQLIQEAQLSVFGKRNVHSTD